MIKTEKKTKLMNLILSLADEGEFLQITDLHKQCPYDCDYGSFRRMIDRLEKDGVIIRERAGLGKIVRPKLRAYDFYR